MKKTFERKVTEETIIKMKELFEMGFDARDVASTLGLNESTVRKYLPQDSHDATARSPAVSSSMSLASRPWLKSASIPCSISSFSIDLA